MKYKLICADCGAPKTYNAPTRQSAFDTARASGWAVNRDRTKCYCPSCAPNHRNTGRRGSRPGVLPAGWQQIKMNLNLN